MSLQPETSNTGAVSALKGYRAQFIYSLGRILTHQQGEATFQPEGKFEDLDIYNEEGKVIEVIQVKNLGKTLTLSDIITQNSRSFLRRAIETHTKGGSPKITLVSFGAVNDDVKELANSEFSNNLKVKLSRFGLKDEQIKILQQYFTFEIVNEDTLTTKIIRILDELNIYIDTKISLDLLVYWIYNSAAGQRTIERNTLQGQLVAIGKFQGDRASFNNNFGTLIRPLTVNDQTLDIKKLQVDFYQGIAATYSHILAGIDIVRPDKLALIDQRFRESNTVFVHGASGEGKSTIAYRYLHDYCEENATFVLIVPADLAVIFEIVNTLEAIAARTMFPVTIYIDAAPGNTDWITVLKELGTKKNLNFLITIREEDWNSIQIDDKFTYAEVELALEKVEAERIYKSLNEFDIDLRFTDFQDAWDIFGESGPLLEFVYLITQGESLPAKLKSQVNRIVTDSSVLGKDKIRLLRFVVLADCFHARVRYQDIAHYLNLDNIFQLTELLEKEYLLKLSDGKLFITGLHPVRSHLLREFLFDHEIHDESEFVLESLHFLDPSTIFSFLRHAFRYADLNPRRLLIKLHGIKINTWIFYNAVLKSLVWKGVSDFVNQNREVLLHALTQFGRGWIAVVDIDIAKAMEGEDIASIHSLLSEEQRVAAKEINSKLTGSEDIFQHCVAWINTIGKMSFDPVTEEEFQGLATFVFWVERLKLGNIDISLSKESIEVGFRKHTLDVLSRTIHAFKTHKGLNSLCEIAMKLFLDRFYRTHNVVSLDENGGEVLCKYFFNMLDAQDYRGSDNLIHSRSIHIINQLRFVYPDKESYGTDGHGHKFSFLPGIHDESHKRIPRRSLPLDYLVEINSIFINLFDYDNRLATWTEYVERVMERRAIQVEVLERSINAFVQYHRKRNYGSLINFVNHFRDILNPTLEKKPMPLFPKVILDQWGLSGEGSRDRNMPFNSDSKKYDQRKALSLLRYETYRKSYQEYDASVTNYLWQSAVVLTRLILERTGQNPEGTTDYSRASLVANLYKAYEKVDEFHQIFREHFVKFVKQQLLDEIENKERACISVICFIYRHFIYSTSYLPGNIVKTAQNHLEQAHDSFFQKVNSGFKTLGKELNSSFTIQWDSQEKRVIVLARNDSSMNIYCSLEHIYNIFHTILDKLDATSIKYAVLSKHYESIFVVPMVGVNSVNGKWYEFKLHNLIDKEFQELEQFNLIASDIPETIRLQYNIQSWNAHLPDFEKLDSMLGCITTASQLAYHFVQFTRFSDVELDERGEKVLDGYLPRVVRTFQENLQKGLDLFNYFQEGCDNNSFTFRNAEEKDEFEVLLLTTRINFFPSDGDAEQGGIQFEIGAIQMEQWVPRLQTLSNNIGLVYLVLSDKVIANHLQSTSAQS